MRSLGSTALCATVLLAAVSGRAQQITMERSAPPGFALAPSETVDRPLDLRGKTYAEIVFIAESTDSNAAVLAPGSAAPLSDLLIEQGIHERAARVWAQQGQFRLGRTICLPTATSSNCVPATLEARGVQFRLVLAPPIPQDQASEKLIATLGTAYASLGVGRSTGSGILTAGIATQGMLSLRDKYFEYDVSLNGRKASGTYGRTGTTGDDDLSFDRLTPAFNLLVAGTPLSGGVRGFAGLYRGGGLAGESGANQFFVRPRMIGVAVQSDDSPLQAGQRSHVKVTLIAPSRITVFSRGLQVYSAFHGIGEHLVGFDGRVGNFVDVVTQDMSGRQERFQTAVIGGIGAVPELPSGWRVEAGRTAERYGTSLGMTAASKGILTLLHRTEMVGHAVQSGVQAGTGGAFRAGFSAASVFGLDGAASESGMTQFRWKGAWMLGHLGESGASGELYGRLGRLLSIGVDASRYRPPVAQTADLNVCSPENGGLCYSSRPYSRTSVSVGIWDWPVRLNFSAFTTANGLSRQTLLQGTSRLPLGNAAGRLLWGILRGKTSGAEFFAFLIYPLDGSSTLMTSSLSGAANGGPTTASASYSYQFDDDIRWLETISQSVQTQVGGTAPLSFHHQLTGQVGSTGINISAAHSARSLDVQGSGSIQYGVSNSGLGFVQPERRTGHGVMSVSSSAALKIVNESLDPQIVVLGSRNIDVPAQSTRLIPVNVGYAPEVSISPGPVSQASRAAMPDYLFAGNVKEIHIQRGAWYNVRFVASGAPTEPLRANHTRDASGDEQHLYQDSRGLSFIFEPANSTTLVRYITRSDGVTPVTHRCEAVIPAVAAPTGIYQALTYECRLEAASSVAINPR